jgi:choline dehydrogenase-like flavoprotein
LIRGAEYGEEEVVIVTYDLIIIGTGAGGGTLLHALAPTGLKILVLERGDYLRREKQNWDPTSVFVEQRYTTNERWRDAAREGVPAGKPLLRRR